MSITRPCSPLNLRIYSRMTKSQLSSPQRLPLAGCPNKSNSKRAGDDGKREKALHAVPARTPARFLFLSPQPPFHKTNCPYTHLLLPSSYFVRVKTGEDISTDIAWDQAPHCGKRRKNWCGRKKTSASEASQEVVRSARYTPRYFSSPLTPFFAFFPAAEPGPRLRQTQVARIQGSQETRAQKLT